MVENCGCERGREVVGYEAGGDGDGVLMLRRRRSFGRAQVEGGCVP